MKSINIGGVEVTSLTDIEGAFFGLDQVFPNVVPEGWTPYLERYPWAFAGPGVLNGRVGAYLIRLPWGPRGKQEIVLVDTGVGPGAFGMRGRLPAELEEAGVAPEDVDFVFLTQLYGDHLGWVLTQKGEPTFPNARHLVQADEWESFAPRMGHALAPLEESGLLDLLYGEEFIGEELTAIPAPGHSPGHQGLLVSSGGEGLVLVGDAIVHPAQVTEPTWNIVFDTDKERSAYTREMLLEWIEADNLVVAAGHVPGSGFGRIVREGERRYWQPLPGESFDPEKEEARGSRAER